jgi:hypothetical protein
MALLRILIPNLNALLFLAFGGVRYLLRQAIGHVPAIDVAANLFPT